MNIVVLAGGISTEREVSLSSGTKVCEALNALGHNAVLVDSFFGVEQLPDNLSDYFADNKKTSVVKVTENAPDLNEVRNSRGESGFGSLGKNVIELCKFADIVYMGLHGEDGENGKMQALFDVLEIRYTGSGYLGSAIAMNKSLAKNVLTAHGIRMPSGITLKKGEKVTVPEDFRMPCIVKPCSGGSSIGLTVADTREQLASAINVAFDYENEILVEEFVSGREFSVGILGDKVLPPIEIIPKGGIYDYAHKYQAGWTEEVCPADITDEQCTEMQKNAGEVARILGLKVYCRIDFIMTEDGVPYCLEANTLPGMTPTSLLPQEAAAIGIDYNLLCQKIIDLSLEKY